LSPNRELFSQHGSIRNVLPKAVNSRYQRSGPLFQGRFRAKRIGKDEYLLHLSRYIHVNPVIRPAIVLEQFSMAENDRHNQLKAYKEFVEEYENEDIERIKHLL
jgi:hypothetical protein